jgi:polyphosphate kinase
MTLSNKAYEDQLHGLQIELVKLQSHLIKTNKKILLLVEGRDAAGKDGVIKVIIEHLSPRETRVVALGKPSDSQEGEWYFQRYVPHLPTKGEFVLFNRSWYNRAGVEKVMGFCSQAEYDEFMRTVIPFESMLIGSGIELHKYYLDISKKEQIKRLESRRKDPLKQWKISPIDQVAVKHWDAYTEAHETMLAQTNHPGASWTVIQTDQKKKARISLIGDFLSKTEYEGKDHSKFHK